LPTRRPRDEYAAREFLRWADYPAELSEKMKWLKVENKEE
jgi:hypothetical protein